MISRSLQKTVSGTEGEKKKIILLGKMLVVVTLLAVDLDTHRGICEEGRLPRGGVNEQVFSLQLVR